MTIQNTAHAAGAVRLHADHMTVKRLGDWTVAERFEVHARRGSVVVDLRSPQLPDGELVLDVDLDRAMLKLLVPDDAVVEYWDVDWTGRGKVKDGVGQQAAKKGEAAEGARRIRLVGRVNDSEVRVNRGGVAILSAMFTREYVDDLRRAHKEGTAPTLDDPARTALTEH
jgi:hypothetical protein